MFFFFVLNYALFFFLGKFRKYDYGIIGNLKKYGKIQPPDYELAKIKIPVHLYYAANDMFINVEVCILIRKFRFILF